MSELTPSAPAPHPAKSSRGLWRFGLSWGIRGGVAGLLLWLCLWSLQGITALVSTVPVTEPPPAPKTNPLAVLDSVDLSRGAWEFLDESWNLTAELLPVEMGQTKLLQPPAKEQFVAASQNVPNDPRGEIAQKRVEDLLKLLEREGKRTQLKLSGESEECYRYLLKRGKIEVVGYVSAPPRRQLVSLRMSIPVSARESWMIEQTPGASGVRRELPASFFPQEIPHQVLCRRGNAQGEPLGEMIRTESTLPEVLAVLQRNSWEFDAPGGNIGSEFVTIHLSRREESGWMIVLPDSDNKSLRILTLREGVRSDTPAIRSSSRSEGSP